MDNFEKLGFEVEVGGKNYTTALSRLDAIISRLDKINKLQNGQKLNKKRFEHFSKTGELTKADTKRAKRSGNVSVYQDLQKQIAKEIELNHIWKQQVETLTQLNLAKQKKLTYDLLANNEDVKSANVQAEISKIMAKTAIDTGVLAKEEGKLAIAKQATAQYDKQSISNMARLQAEQKALNDGKWEEARRIELANQQRKKEIDERLKLRLGLKQEKKQVEDNTKSWSKYLAKVTSITLIARKFAHLVTDAVNESAKYIENLNLFAVAFGDTYQESLKWALNMADAYGLASNEVVRFAGTFRELSTSLGIVEDTADKVTETVTKLGYDLAALYNTTVEQAMEKLQSGIFSGNVRPLRSFGIDISQNQIDALFETNQALASMGVNARNLSQSDKVIARLVIALQSGTDAFGTMYREINNLQSQFRIFQGSLANFKLAVGDLVQQPIANAMVYINAFIIAITDIIRAFVPLKTIDETPVGNLGAEADEASEALDNLNGKLADFDKFNVLGGQSSGGSQLAVTEALNKLLEEQVTLYEDRLTSAMEAATNEATELAKKIRGWFIVVDEEGKFVEWTDNAKLLGIALNEIGLIILYVFGKKIITSMVGFFTKYITNIQELRLQNALATTTFQKLQVALNAVISGVLSLTMGIAALVMNWDNMSDASKFITIFVSLAASIGAAAAALYLFKQNYAMALGVGATVLGTGLTIGSQLGSMTKHADGGYTNANLIMTHENGKREWVGKAAGSSAIVNDTQMSDIMEVAVAKGVYNALSARSAMGGNVPTNETIVVKISEEAVFNAVRKTARRQGRDFANV